MSSVSVLTFTSSAFAQQPVRAQSLSSIRIPIATMNRLAQLPFTPATQPSGMPWPATKPTKTQASVSPQSQTVATQGCVGTAPWDAVSICANAYTTSGTYMYQFVGSASINAGFSDQIGHIEIWGPSIGDGNCQNVTLTQSGTSCGTGPIDQWVQSGNYCSEWWQETSAGNYQSDGIACVYVS